MSKELKACPLCGTTEYLMVYEEWIPTQKNKGVDMGVVDCTKDYCPMIVRASTIEEAVRKWNERPLEDSLLDEIELLNKKLMIVETMFQEAEKLDEEASNRYELVFGELIDIIYNTKIKLSKVER